MRPKAAIIVPTARPAQASGRRGISLVYLTVTVVALMAFVSLAVDVGRVYVAKAELQLAADAAARHAAAGLKDGVLVAQANAVAAAADNKADGRTVVLSPNLGDVEFGVWDDAARSFTVLTGAARSGANAVRVSPRLTDARGTAVPLTWGALIGLSTCDIKSVSAVAKAPTSAPYSGFLGINSVTLGNNGLVAGYDSNSGAPGAGNISNTGNIGSNGQIDVGNNTAVRGDVFTDDFDQGSGSTLTGEQLDDLPPMSFSPTEDPGIPSAGNLTVGQDETLTLGAGTFHYTNVTLGHGATLTFSGPAKLYVSGSITLGNNRSSLVASDNTPGNLKLRLVGSASFEAGNDALIVAEIYGPQAQFQIGNNVEMHGAVIAASIAIGNNAVLYYDSRIGAGGTGGRVILVR